MSTSTQNSTVIDESKSSLLLFDIVSTTFIPGKISSEKRCRNSGPLPNLGRFTVLSKIQNIIKFAVKYVHLNYVLYMHFSVTFYSRSCSDPASDDDGLSCYGMYNTGEQFFNIRRESWFNAFEEWSQAQPRVSRFL